MKKIIKIFFLVSLCFVMNAQNEYLFFLNTGISGNSLLDGQIGINFIANHKFSFKLEYSGMLCKQKNTPEDYSSELQYLLDRCSKY